MAHNLQSLITILQQILNPLQTHWIFDHNKPQLESLLQKAIFLQQILEKSPLPKIGSLETQIRDTTHKAEDLIESHMVDQMKSSSSTFSTPDLHQVMQELDSATEEANKLVKGKKTSNGSSSSMSSASVSHDSWSSKSVVVGIDQDLKDLKDKLIGKESKLEIIPIVGMGGIGKSTLARNLYEDLTIVSHFDARAWVRISQDYNMRAILLGLLHCIIGNLNDEVTKCSDGELETKLYKRLYDERYLIVLDDIWGNKFWDDVHKFFPNEDKGSRIVITTRESGVADYATSHSPQHKVKLLSNHSSCSLLRQIVFGKENCPYVFEGILEKIAVDCGGLPLAINVVGGLLSNAQKSLHVWDNIGNDVRGAIVDSGDQRMSNILSLTYNHLPHHLKPCFLYMGAFPVYYEIKASRLIRMWVAEGFLKSSGGSSLEVQAESYLKALVERNLVLVTQDKCNGKAKRYGMHDLLRDLCVRKADEEKFLHVKNVANSSLRRVSVHTSSYGQEDAVYASVESMSLARSFICIKNEILSPSFFVFKLLRVLDIMEMEFPFFPREIFELVNLRYLAVSCSSCLPSGISRLCNLQTLIASFGWGDLPCEIWEMSELRHLKLNEVIWVDGEYTKAFVQKMLQTISLVRLTRSLIQNGFFEGIPNIKNLGIYCDILPSSTVDLSHLHKLETLTCQSSRRRLLPILSFPDSIRKLTLVRCVIFPGVLNTLCVLRKLEVLIIRECVFESEDTFEEWEAEEGDAFSSLKFLLLEKLNLVRWRADETNFPKLRYLLLRFCLKLEGIPSDIGHIPTLKLIGLHRCKASVVDSAKEIKEVQQSDYDNYDIDVRTW